MDHTLAPVDPQALIAGMPSVEAVRELEAALIGFPQVDLSTTHLVHGGLSARTILIPAGTVLTGALTNCDNVCVLCGDITVTTDTGPVRLLGFNVLPAKAGSKRVGVAHADTWWTTLHRTDLTDIAAIEEEMTGEADLLQTRRACIANEQHEQIEGVEP